MVVADRDAAKALSDLEQSGKDMIRFVPCPCHLLVIVCCRATARVTTGQRKSLDQIEQVTENKGEDGNTYWTYDHISQVNI